MFFSAYTRSIVYYIQMLGDTWFLHVCGLCDALNDSSTGANWFTESGRARCQKPRLSAIEFVYYMFREEIPHAHCIRRTFSPCRREIPCMCVVFMSTMCDIYLAPFCSFGSSVGNPNEKTTATMDGDDGRETKLFYSLINWTAVFSF